MRLCGQVAVQGLYETHEEMRLRNSGQMPEETQRRHNAVSFRQDLPERSVQQPEINFRQTQKNGSPKEEPFFVYFPEKITRISTSCAFSAVPASAAREAGGAYQDDLADRDGHRDAAAASAAVSARAGSRVSQAAVFPAVSDEHPDGQADSDAEAVVFPAVSDGHPDDQADSDAEAGRIVWLLQAGARLRRLQALKVSYVHPFL